MLIISILKEYNQLQEKQEKLQWRSNRIADLMSVYCLPSYVDMDGINQSCGINDLRKTETLYNFNCRSLYFYLHFVSCYSIGCFMPPEGPNE